MLDEKLDIMLKIKKRINNYVSFLLDTKKAQTNNKTIPLTGNLCLLLISSIFIVCISPSKANTIHFLNQEERQWLEKIQQPIKIGLTSIPSQVLRNKNGGYKGFSIDLFKKIQETLSINFEYVYFETWNEIINAGEKGNIDIIFLAQKTESRLVHFDFTDTVISQQNKIITKTNKPNNLTLKDLFGLNVAVSKGSAVFEYLKHNFTHINLIPTQNEEESLSYVSNDLADAAITGAVRASYYLEKLNIKNLRITGDLGYDYHLRIASRNNLPILNVILTKAIDIIPIEDIQALHLKWGYVKDRESYFDKQMLIYFSIAFGVIIPFTVHVSFLNRDLRDRISDKKKALQELRIAHDEIHHLKDVAEQEARTDALTNVLNNRGFREKLHNYIEKHKRNQHTFSLVLIDIDYFKKINDKMGHDTGDKVLSNFVQVINNTLRTYDHLGRVGGEEFALIFPNTNLVKAAEIIERLRTCVNNHTFNINQFTFQVTASFGVAEVTKLDTKTSIFKRADELLYRSKSNGRDRVSS